MTYSKGRFKKIPLGAEGKVARSRHRMDVGRLSKRIQAARMREVAVETDGVRPF